MTISLIAAVSKNGVIGKDGKVPWNLPADLKYFADKTGGHPVIMGHKTFRSIRDNLGGPLPGRKNVVLVSRPAVCDGCETALTIDRMFLPLADFLYITRVDVEVGGDASFPRYSEFEWELVSSDPRTKDAKNPFDYTFEVYKRKKVYVDLAHARTPDQLAVMSRITAEGVCPFCPENLAKYHHKEIIREGKFWVLTLTQWPKSNTRIHLLAIYKFHAETLSEMNPQAGVELFELLTWAEAFFKVIGGMFFLRFGESSYSGASVKHLHVQFVVPDMGKPDFEPVRFKVGTVRKPEGS